MSKILITGNGFDLFHHLPTKYHHFISIMETIEKFQPSKEATFEDLFGRIFKDKYLDDYNSIVENYNVEKIQFDKSKIRQIDELLKTNLWYIFFKNVIDIETWIDFEIEVENILKQLSILLKSETPQFKKVNYYRDVPVNYFDFNLLGIIEQKTVEKEVFSIPDKYVDKRKLGIKSERILRDLSSSFEDFIVIFNRYLVDVVSVFYAEIKQKPLIPFQLMDEIYTFNYTPTLETFYNVEKLKVVYLHGKINEVNNIQNLILGVAEIPDEIQSKKAFEFTKYYQKIIKGSNCNFIEVPTKSTDISEENIFYIFGHSLDKSDNEYIEQIFKYLEKDYLKKSNIVVFYYNQKDYKNKLKNLFSFIGKEIINKFNASKRLKFVELNEENIINEFSKKLYDKYESYTM